MGHPTLRLEDLSELLSSSNGCQYSDVADGCLDQISSFSGEVINIMHLNIRSLSQNADNLLMLLNDLQKRNVIVHAIGLCETFLTDMSKSTIQIENYKLCHKCRSSKVGGGVSLLIHDTVTSCMLTDSLFEECFESIAGVMQISDENILVAEFYCPPNSDNASFLHHLSEFLCVVNKYKYCYICSDQNL